MTLVVMLPILQTVTWRSFLRLHRMRSEGREGWKEKECVDEGVLARFSFRVVAFPLFHFFLCIFFFLFFANTLSTHWLQRYKPPPLKPQGARWYSK